MTGARDDAQRLFAPHGSQRLLVQLNDEMIFAADDKQCGRCDLAQSLASQIGTAATRDHSADLFTQFCRGHERGAAAGARAKETEFQMLRFGFLVHYSRRLFEPLREQANVEA